MEWVCGIVGVLFVLGVIGAAFAGPTKCGICSNELKKKSYTWNIDGKKMTLCPKCNSRMESKTSKEAFNAFMAKRK